MSLVQVLARPAQLDAPPAPPPPSVPLATLRTSSLTRSPTFASARLDRSNLTAATVMSALKTNIMINHYQQHVKIVMQRLPNALLAFQPPNAPPAALAMFSNLEPVFAPTSSPTRLHQAFPPATIVSLTSIKTALAAEPLSFSI